MGDGLGIGLAGASLSSRKRFVQLQRVPRGQLRGRVGLGSASSMPKDVADGVPAAGSPPSGL